MSFEFLSILRCPVKNVSLRRDWTRDRRWIFEQRSSKYRNYRDVKVDRNNAHIFSNLLFRSIHSRSHQTLRRKPMPSQRVGQVDPSILAQILKNLA